MNPPELPHTLKIVTVWLLILLALTLGFKALERSRERSRLTIEGSRIELKRAPDGHFHWRGEVNGIEVDFLVDTGATSTALPQALAERAGLVKDVATQSSTAGGVAQGYRARADITLAGGIRAERLPVTVLPALEVPLLGMDVLSKMHFTQRDGVLRFEAP